MSAPTFSRRLPSLDSPDTLIRLDEVHGAGGARVDE